MTPEETGIAPPDPVNVRLDTARLCGPRNSVPKLVPLPSVMAELPEIALGAPRASVPDSISVGPVLVLDQESVSVAGPVFRSEVEPEKMPP